MSTATSPPLLRVGRTVGDYVLLSELGRGGFGIVFEAKDLRDNSRVALKTLRADLSSAQGQRALTRFLLEVRAVRQIKHPNVVKLIDAGRVDGDDGSVLAYYAMELLQGETLDQLVRTKGPMDALAAASVIRQAAVGLYTAHAQGIIHRDIKPGNIMLVTGGRAVVTDFGVCKILELQNVTTAGQVVGTARYLSPEQFLGITVDARSDVFALGALLFFLLTGEHLRISKDLVTLSRQVTRGEDVKRVKEQPNLLPSFRKVLIVACAQDPAHRYQSALDLAHALEEACLKKDVLNRFGKVLASDHTHQRSDPDKTAEEAAPERTRVEDQHAVSVGTDPDQTVLTMSHSTVITRGDEAVVSVVSDEHSLPASSGARPWRLLGLTVGAAVVSAVLLGVLWPTGTPTLEPPPPPTVVTVPPRTRVAATVASAQGRVSFPRRHDSVPGARLVEQADAPLQDLMLCAHRLTTGAMPAQVVRDPASVLGCARTGLDGGFTIRFTQPVESFVLGTAFCDGVANPGATSAEFCVMNGDVDETGRAVGAAWWSGPLRKASGVDVRLVLAPPEGGTNVPSLEDVAHVFAAATLARAVLGSFRPEPETAHAVCTHPACQAPLQLLLCGHPGARDPRCAPSLHAFKEPQAAAVHQPRDGPAVLHAMAHVLQRRWLSAVDDAVPEGCPLSAPTAPCGEPAALAVEGFAQAFATAVWLQPGTTQASVAGIALKDAQAARPRTAAGPATLSEATSFFWSLMDVGDDAPGCTIHVPPSPALKAWSHPSLAGQRASVDARAYLRALEQTAVIPSCAQEVLGSWHL
ncbi:MAG: serine/threonine-protein kinase [Myxococcota bacterium]